LCCLSFYIIRYFILLSGIFIYRVGKLIEPWFPQRQSEIESWDQDIFSFLFSMSCFLTGCEKGPALFDQIQHTLTGFESQSQNCSTKSVLDLRIACVLKCASSLTNTNQNHIQTTQESLSCLRLKLLRLNQYLSVHAVKFFLEWALFFFTRFTQLLIEIKECSMKMDVCHKICK